MEQLKFCSVGSVVDASFFNQLGELKLNKFKLDNGTETVYGYMTCPDKINKFTTSPMVLLDYLSFNQENDNSNSKGNLVIKGSLINYNTIEEFKELDKLQFLKTLAADLLAYMSQPHISIPSFAKMSTFTVISFSDLKKHKFYYWFAFPALHSSWKVLETEKVPADKLDQYRFQSPDVFVAQTEDSESDSWINSSSFVFHDLSSHLLPSVQLKNYLYFLALKGKSEIKLTIVKGLTSATTYTMQLVDPLDLFDSTALPKLTGWERNSNAKLGPKLANLGALIDPHQLAEQAVDLNLKLMKWRIAPDLDLNFIQRQKVLLLGAGTLGSYVARVLMGWGVRKITFVDNGRVSYSNPVRQPLFKFDDCHSDEGQGQLKALQAAKSLKEIFPGVESEGYDLRVPMVGHPVATLDEEKVKTEFEKLESLFDHHDVIFLLMDSRESRWLPTVLGLAKDKLVLNAALGFDSYLVMRHGVNNEDQDKSKRLGCYFCNDIVAPDDSLSGRTLDQMCTVTRPGVALMASSLAVELLASVLQHPEGKKVGADFQSQENGASNVLGEVPHQIRGFLHNFSQNKFVAPAFKQCSACSEPIIEGYRERGWDFIKKCLNDSKYLEEISGLTALQDAAEAGALELDDLEISDEDAEWLD